MSAVQAFWIVVVLDSLSDGALISTEVGIGINAVSAATEPVTSMIIAVPGRPSLVRLPAAT